MFAQLAIVLAGSKVWFSGDTKTEDFFRDLKKKISPLIPSGLACAVAVAYMKLECSDMVSSAMIIGPIPLNADVGGGSSGLEGRRRKGPPRVYG